MNGPVSNASEAVWTGGEMHLQHWRHPGPQSQVGETHNAGGDTHGAILTTGAHGGNTLHEFGLAHGLHCLRTVLPIH